MKDIVLKITGRTLSSIPKPPEGAEDGPIEFITEGKLSSRGSVMFISYDESPLSGMTGCKTSLTISPKKVKLRRSGEHITKDTVMEFEEGKRHTALYETPMGSIGMEILTDKISPFQPVGENTDKMTIEYAISLKGLLEARKSLDIEVVGKN